MSLRSRIARAEAGRAAGSRRPEATTAYRGFVPKWVRVTCFAVAGRAFEDVEIAQGMRGGSATLE
jgi:hypothetical protein